MVADRQSFVDVLLLVLSHWACAAKGQCSRFCLLFVIIVIVVIVVILVACGMLSWFLRKKLKTL